MTGFDLTLPVWPLTGRERSAEDLATPDERNQRYGVGLLELQSGYYHAEALLSPAVPPHLRDRTAVARDLGAYAWFRYELHAASLFWSISSIEMALRYKFAQENRGPFQVQKANKQEQVQAVELEARLRRGWRIAGMPMFDCSFHSLLDWAFGSGQLPRDTPIVLQEITHRHHNRFRLEIFPEYALQAGLVGPNPTVGEIDSAWARLGPEGQKEAYDFDNGKILTQELPDLRNRMAHPTFHMVSVPRSAIDGYRQLVEIVSRLWPHANQNPKGQSGGNIRSG